MKTLLINFARTASILLTMSLIASCAATKLNFKDKDSVTKKNLEVSISYPSGKYDCTINSLGLTWGCNRFILSVKNTSSHDYFIDWNKSYYLQNGQARGGFYFEGVTIKDRNNTKPDDVILSNSAFTKTIYPNILTSFNGSWEREGFPLGENGVYLTIKDDEGIKNKIKLNLSLSK